MNLIGTLDKSSGDSLRKVRDDIKLKQKDFSSEAVVRERLQTAVDFLKEIHVRNDAKLCVKAVQRDVVCLLTINYLFQNINKSTW